METGLVVNRKESVIQHGQKIVGQLSITMTKHPRSLPCKEKRDGVSFSGKGYIK
jgi:hypothetical protein